MSFHTKDEWGARPGSGWRHRWLSNGSPIRSFLPASIQTGRFLTPTTHLPGIRQIADGLSDPSSIAAAAGRLGVATGLVAASAGLGHLVDAASLPYLSFAPAIMLAGFCLGATSGLYAAQLSTALAVILFHSRQTSTGPAALGLSSAILFDMIAISIAIMSSTCGASIARAQRGKAALESRIAEEVRRRLQVEDSLRQSQKMEAVGQLTGGLAHDFNNMLAGIDGSLDLIEALLRRGRSDGLLPYIESARGSSGRAAALTRRLLAFSRQTALDPQVVDAGTLIGGMGDMLAHSLGPSILLEISPAADLWPTRIDAGQLENALLNLCINARDAMPDGGTISVTSVNLRLDLVAAAERGLAPGDYIAVRVVDEGIGMSAEIAARVFEPFFTTKPVGTGTGLGLSMVHGFARQCGGGVEVQSTEGIGTCIGLLLPRAGVEMGAPTPSYS